LLIKTKICHRVRVCGRNLIKECGPINECSNKYLTIDHYEHFVLSLKVINLLPIVIILNDTTPSAVDEMEGRDTIRTRSLDL
jgi:hypothetical protein